MKPRWLISSLLVANLATGQESQTIDSNLSAESPPHQEAAKIQAEPKLAPEDRQLFTGVAEMGMAGDREAALAFFESHPLQDKDPIFEFVKGNINLQLGRAEPPRRDSDD